MAIVLFNTRQAVDHEGRNREIFIKLIIRLPQRDFVNPPSLIHYENVECDGTEVDLRGIDDDLRQCSFSPVSTSVDPSLHIRDVHIVCLPITEPYSS